MTIGIDASRALREKRTGTEVYNAEIIKHLGSIDTKNFYRLYASKPPTGDMLHVGKSASQHIEWRVMPFPRGWTLLRLSWEMLWQAPDVLFVPSHTLPLIPTKRAVVMIHDLGYDHFPELYKWTDIVYHHFVVRFAKHFAAHILTPSEFTRRDLHEKYAIPLEKITTIHHGFDAKQYHPVEGNEKPPIDEPYFYFIGRLEYKKNISRMLEAFVQFKEQTGLPHKFILAGRQAYGYNAIQNTVDSLGQWKKDVTFLGYTPQEQSTYYLRHAQTLVFTTLFEGFGFPVLEGFASGVPVITSTTTSLPEIAGEAALLVEPTHTNEIAKAMIQIAREPALRHSLIAKGHERVKAFSWENTARETLRVLEGVGQHA